MVAVRSPAAKRTAANHTAANRATASRMAQRAARHAASHRRPAGNDIPSASAADAASADDLSSDGLSGAPARTAALVDWTDIVLYLALFTLPADGTRLGPLMTYWTPISPWLFLLYALLNCRRCPATFRRFMPFFVFAAILLAVSVVNWLTVGFNPSGTFMTLSGIITALACLMTLDIAFHGKHVSWQTALTVVIIAYWIAFAVGVGQYLTDMNHWKLPKLWNYEGLLFPRQYFVVRPQFLFAEPSYIGMHLFGVLLPLYWLTRRRSLAVLICTFAAGSILMKTGSRIMLDTLVAAVLCFIVMFDFRKNRAKTIAVCGTGLVAVVAGCIWVATRPRFRSVLSQGLLNGDFSTNSRMFHIIDPLLAGLNNIPHLLFGFGAGNLTSVLREGYAPAAAWTQAHGGSVNSEIESIGKLPDTPDPWLPPTTQAFTMSFFATFIAEFGVLLLAAFLLLALAWIARHHMWNKQTVCWLILLAYLYAQFEAYAFYAFWLFIYIIATQRYGVHTQPSGTVSYTIRRGRTRR